MPALHRRTLPSRRPTVDGGMRKCRAVEDFARRGACPPLGSGGAWQNPPCQLAAKNHNSSFSYLRVPAPAGMSDWYENAPTPLRLCLNATAPALVVPAPQFVIPAKAGIHALTFRERTPTAIPHLPPQGDPTSSFRRKHTPNRDTAPESRGVGRGECSEVEDYARRGTCPPLGRRWGMAKPTVPIRRKKPQLQPFIPSCAGASRHERLV